MDISTEQIKDGGSSIRKLRETAGGYFTVEAALLFPFVLGVILLVIYLWFYSYDRCLMEQDCAIALVEALGERGVSPEERVGILLEKYESIYKDEYVGWIPQAAEASYSKGVLSIKQSGKLRFPFRGLIFWNGKDVWTAKVSYKGSVIKKMFGIRTYRKINGLIQGDRND
jgi:hypothetical protein